MMVHNRITFVCNIVNEPVPNTKAPLGHRNLLNLLRDEHSRGPHTLEGVDAILP